MKIAVFFRYKLKYVLLLILLLGGNKSMLAQCPPNIDFEQGNFSGWECWVGHAYNQSSKNVILWDDAPGPVDPALYPTRFQMLSNPPGNGRDQYGLFPRNCPNGSGHSIQLGNDDRPGNHQAEGVSYTFTIPLGQNQFNIIFHYAIVFQGPQHANYEQPRLKIDVMNLTDNIRIDCSSFDFFKDVNNTLPGFYLSQTNNTGTPVWCKNWSASSIKLDNMEGKTIQLFFKTADCVFQQHFGYAYVDVNTQCSSSFVGAVFCPDDTAVNVTAPYGYETYKWWDVLDPTTILSTTQTINFTPPPTPGTILKVALTPYAGYGCVDTLTVQLIDTLTIQSQAGPDKLSCQNDPVQLGANPTPGYVYSWSPVTGLDDPTISNPLASPSVTTEYILTTRSAGGGCVTTDTVIVSAAVLDTSLLITGPTSGCILVPQPTTLEVPPADSIQWYLNGVAIPGATQPLYNVLQGGSYYATVFSFVGCSLSTNPVLIDVNAAPTVGFNINSANQCFVNNQFVFTNTSTVITGTLSYNWDLGDGTTANTTNVTYSYAQPGTYIVRLIVTTDKGCIDTVSYTVNVFENPVAGFTVNTAQQCLGHNSFVFTNTSVLNTGTSKYLWTFGDATSDTTRDVTHSYTLAGTYTVRLLVTSDKGCTDTTSFDVTANPGPVAGFSVVNPQQCFNNNLFNFINSTTLSSGTLKYFWDLGDGTTDTTRNVTHSYAQPGDYVVKMLATSNGACADSMTMNVKIFGYATPDFYVAPICTNLRLPLTNKTINTTGMPLNYLWDFGNGQTSTQINPVYSYPAPGNYTITLSVSTNQCPLTLNVKQVNLVIEAPAPAIRYADKEVVMNFELPLAARPIGNSVLWSPPTSLDNPGSYNPVFKGLDPQLYTITLKTLLGCVTVDTQYVKTRKKIEIYVPTSFTPNGDGRNDYLRPFTLSFRSVTYFRVYNRWGKLLYQMQSDVPGWDGRVNGQVQEMQTVVWMIEAVDVDGNVHKKQGTSILLH
ncbi:MAG: PKD domain-containing protein [Ferruginibacter sp.]